MSDAVFLYKAVVHLPLFFNVLKSSQFLYLSLFNVGVIGRDLITEINNR